MDLFFVVLPFILKILASFYMHVTCPSHDKSKNEVFLFILPCFHPLNIFKTHFLNFYFEKHKSKY